MNPDEQPEEVILSIDNETTGLDPENCSIIQMAMVLETPSLALPIDALPWWVGYVHAPVYTGEAGALVMHRPIWRRLASVPVASDWYRTSQEYAQACCLIHGDAIPSNGQVDIGASVDELGHKAVKWLLNSRALKTDTDRLTAAGKNLGTFDWAFMPQVLKNRLRHRVIDPGSVFMDWSRAYPPSLPELLERFGLGTVAHDALEDARDVIRVLRCAPGYGRRAGDNEPAPR